MKRSNKTILAAALAAAVLFAGCSSSNSGRRSDSGRNSENEAAREVAIETTAAAGDYEYGYSLNDTVYEGAAAPEEFSNSIGTSGGSTTSVSGSDIVSSDRMLIRYVTVSCETLHFQELTTSIESQVAAVGGYIESKNFSGTGNAGDLRSASYTIRVTSENLANSSASSAMPPSSQVPMRARKTSHSPTLTHRRGSSHSA